MDSKSTTGGLLMVIGPNTSDPLGHLCKKQGAVSHSSTEAEIVALDACLRVDGIPALSLWDQILQTCAPGKLKDQLVKTNDRNNSLSLFLVRVVLARMLTLLFETLTTSHLTCPWPLDQRNYVF